MGPTYIWHMYLLPMSYNIAQSLGIVVVLLLLIQLRNDKIDKCNFILCLCCLICCAGTKSAAGAVIINILVTGGIHIDGYMDTMDALHSYQPVEKKLEILKDAHIGAFAVIMLSVLLLAYIGALPGIDFNNVPLFASTFVFSRILSGLSVVLFKGAKKGGMLYAFSSSAQKKVVCISLVMEFLFMAAGTIWIYKIKAVFVIVAMLIVFIYYRYKSYKEFGGITGDLAGWFLCLSEMVAVILCVFI